jgi:hypothetical protein
MPLPWLLAIELSEFLKLRFCPLMIGARPLGNHLPTLRLAGLAPLLFIWRLARPIAGVGVLKQPASLQIREGGALSLCLRLFLEEKAAVCVSGLCSNQSERGKPAKPPGKAEDNRA